MSQMPPRLTQAQQYQARKAGMIVPPAAKGTLFGSMFSWFPSIQFGRPTFWPTGANARGPVNSSSSDTGIIVSPGSVLSLSAAWACIWLTARTMASMPLDLKRYDKGGKGVIDEDNSLYEVLRWRPNRDMTAYDFWTAMWACVLLWGSGYARKHTTGKQKKQVVALEFLNPQFMTAYLTDKGELRYRYDEPNKPQDFTADELFVLKERTLDGITGASIIEFARNSMGLAQAGEAAASRTFKKGLNASGFIKVEKFLKSEQRTEFRNSIDEFTGEGPRAGGTMVLEGGTDYKQLSMKPLDAELLSSRQFSVEDVCRWFGTPPILIGHASSGQTMWGSGIEQIFRGWLNLSLRPYITAATQSIRKSLIDPSDRATLYAEYDLDDLLAADSQARAMLYSQLSQNGINTRNELREKEGLGPMPGGDDLTVQSNLVPLSQLGQAPANGSGDANQLRAALTNFLQMSTAPTEGPKL